MENALKEKLEGYGLLISDLTDDELKELKKEIEQESKGVVIIDGVLSNISPIERIVKRENK